MRWESREASCIRWSHLARTICVQERPLIPISTVALQKCPSNLKCLAPSWQVSPYGFDVPIHDYSKPELSPRLAYARLRAGHSNVDVGTCGNAFRIVSLSGRFD